MCEGGRLLADFEVGNRWRPEVPDAVARCLTLTVEEAWVVWAHKLAVAAGREFTPMTGGSPYPADAVAECRRGGGHEAPEPGCTCGFHAVAFDSPGGEGSWAAMAGPFHTLHLDVALWGRVLAFEWHPGALLFRAARQTVIRVTGPARERPRPPDDPEGRLAQTARGYPRGSGPLRLDLPLAALAPIVAVADDAGFCTPRAGRALPARPARPAPAPALV